MKAAKSATREFIFKQEPLPSNEIADFLSKTIDAHIKYKELLLSGIENKKRLIDTLRRNNRKFDFDKYRKKYDEKFSRLQKEYENMNKEEYFNSSAITSISTTNSIPIDKKERLKKIKEKIKEKISKEKKLEIDEELDEIRRISNSQKPPFKSPQNINLNITDDYINLTTSLGINSSIISPIVHKSPVRSPIKSIQKQQDIKSPILENQQQSYKITEIDKKDQDTISPIVHKSPVRSPIKSIQKQQDIKSPLSDTHIVVKNIKSVNSELASSSIKDNITENKKECLLKINSISKNIDQTNNNSLELNIHDNSDDTSSESSDEEILKFKNSLNKNYINNKNAESPVISIKSSNASIKKDVPRSITSNNKVIKTVISNPNTSGFSHEKIDKIKKSLNMTEIPHALLNSSSQLPIKTSYTPFSSISTINQSFHIENEESNRNKNYRETINRLKSLSVTKDQKEPSTVSSGPQSLYIKSVVTKTQANSSFSENSEFSTLDSKEKIIYKTIRRKKRNEIAELEEKSHLLHKFQILKGKYPEWVSHYHFSLDTDLKVMKSTYELILKDIKLKSKVNTYSSYLYYGFFFFEYFLGNIIGFDMEGFSKEQIEKIKDYEHLLEELGEKEYTSKIIGSGWCVEIRLLMTIAINAAFFIIFKIFTKKTNLDITGISGNYRENNNGYLNTSNISKFESIDKDKLPKNIMTDPIRKVSSLIETE